jgi:hypothetical protein
MTLFQLREVIKTHSDLVKRYFKQELITVSVGIGSSRGRVSRRKEKELARKMTLAYCLIIDNLY